MPSGRCRSAVGVAEVQAVDAHGAVRAATRARHRERAGDAVERPRRGAGRERPLALRVGEHPDGVLPVAVVEAAHPQLAAVGAGDQRVELDVDERVAVRRAGEAHLGDVPERRRLRRGDRRRAAGDRRILIGRVRLDRRRVGRTRVRPLAELRQRRPQALALGGVRQRRHEADQLAEPPAAELRGHRRRRDAGHEPLEHRPGGGVVEGFAEGGGAVEHGGAFRIQEAVAVRMASSTRASTCGGVNMRAAATGRPDPHSVSARTASTRSGATSASVASSAS